MKTTTKFATKIGHGAAVHEGCTMTDRFGDKYTLVTCGTDVKNRSAIRTVDAELTCKRCVAARASRIEFLAQQIANERHAQARGGI